jgi:uncharacterized protein (TIGR03435 family)
MPRTAANGCFRKISTLFKARGVRHAILSDKFLNVGQKSGRPIIDKTNLTATYDFTLKFAPVANTATTGSREPAAEPTGPSIFTAIQEQLGLKLESSKAPMEVLVINSAQHPSEN